MLSVEQINKLEQENAELKADKDKYYQQTLDDEIQINELYQEIERLKADNDHIQNNFIQQLKYEKQALDDAIKYKTCLQEIDEIISRTDSQHPPSVANMVSIIRHKLYELTNTEEE